MKKLLFLISIVAMMASCSKSPADRAVSINEEAAEEFENVDSYKSLGEALTNYAKNADEFVKDNQDFKPEGDDLEKVKASEEKLQKAMSKSQETLQAKYAGKENESMAEVMELLGVMGSIEQTYPDAQKFQYSNAQ